MRIWTGSILFRIDFCEHGEHGKRRQIPRPAEKLLALQELFSMELEQAHCHGECTK
jgi:hypothetical protein